jgi:thioredoxin-related protein
MKSTALIIFSIIALLSSNSWVYDIDEAISIAEEQNRKILMVFAGSDWCIPCKKFEKTILSSPDFKKFQENELVVLYLDFPVKKKNQLTEAQKLHNEGLAAKYNQSGVFPKILLLSSKGDMLRDVKFKNQNAREFIQEIKMNS